MLNTARILPSESRFGASPDNSQLIRVLVVDDEPAALKLLCLFLATPAFHCTSANNGEEALEALQREPFDAVISDLSMPGMGGMELLAQARRSQPYVAFVVTTGVDDVEVGVQAMRNGADDYLVKPLTEGAVLASLERGVRRRQLEQEVENYREHLEELVAERTAQLQAAFCQIQCGYEDTLQALGAAIDLRDKQTAGHSRRVCGYSLEMARAMSLPDALVRNIVRGAYLHDIGKLGIPDGILLKPGPLTADERNLIQQHVQIGFELVKGISFLAEAAEIVFAHHERFDGSGYPRGLRTQEIPMGARIFSVADTLDAITSDRPYSCALSFEEAREMIGKQAGRLFDPEIVKVFLDIPVDTWPRIARDQGHITPLTYRSREVQLLSNSSPSPVS